MLTKFKKYLEKLKENGEKSNEQFKELFNEGTSILGLLDMDISRQFSVSRSTINKWRTGENAPHPAMQKIIFEYFEKMALSFIDKE